MRRALLFSCLALAAAGCQPKTNPNDGKYSCTTDADCGSGYECRPQAAGGGLCYPQGLCADTETCDGVDDNCNGEVDETFPDAGAACDSGKPGKCAVGETVCQFGAVGCLQTVQPSGELCNGIDDDCDGFTDEDFDSTSDSLNCGACGVACDAGTRCELSACHESDCTDGLDNDDNGYVDCDDDFCFILECDGGSAPPWHCGILFGDGGLRPDGGSWDAGPGPDAGMADGGSDGGAMDGGTDGGAMDGGAMDGGAMDGGATDGGAMDGGATDGGADGGEVDAGRPGLRGCFLPETACDDGLDNDGDLLPDCLDPDCDGLTCVSGTVCTMGSCPGPG